MGGLTVAAPAWAPLCMDEDEWAGWRRHNERLAVAQYGDTKRAQRPCEDCPLGHAADMRALGRCNGEPGGIEDEEETVEPTPTAAAKVAVTRTRVRFEAPCRTCSHAPVCRLREGIIAASEVSVEVPVLGDGVRLALAGSVECDWYVKAKRPPEAAPKPRREMTPEEKEAARERMLRARAIGVEKKAAAAARAVEG